VSTDIEKLLKLQEKDRELRQFQLEAEEIPRQQKQLDSRLEKQRLVTEKVTGILNRLQAEIRELENDVEASKEKVAKYRKQQMEVKDNEAFRALENEIRTLTRHIGNQDDITITQMEKLESQTAIVDEADTELNSQIKELAHDVAVMEERRKELEGLIERLNQDRISIAEGIDKTWLTRYERTFKHTGDLALARSNKGTCEGCHMKLPPSLVHESKSIETVTQCTYCGRMLFFEL